MRNICRFEEFRLSILLTVICIFAVPLISSAAAPRYSEFARLPLGVQTWYKFETEYLSREVDTQKFTSPTQNDQDEFYSPEAQNIFDVVGYWLPVKDFNLATDSMPKDVRQTFFRKRGSQREALFLVHPESVDLYQTIISRSRGSENFRAMATSSSRSLLMWRTGDEEHPFIGKLSLNKTIAHALRTILDGESIHSILINQIVNARNSGEEFPANAFFMSEVFSSFPTEQKDTGMIIRLIPRTLLKSRSTFAPLFALYGGAGNRKSSVMLDLAKAESLSPEEFLNERILKPFAKLWIDLELDHGITMEPHAQ